jgi:ATP adenylyltransferase
MEEMRTPWRMEYITSTTKQTACIFCPPPGEPHRERLVLERGVTAFTILNLYPYATGHLMVVPCRHLPRFRDLRVDERAEVAAMLRRAERILREVTGARRFHAGINLGRAAGAGVDGHLHAHLVPRDARGDWADRPGAEAPALSVDEVRRRLAPYFVAGAGSST